MFPRIKEADVSDNDSYNTKLYGKASVNESIITTSSVYSDVGKLNNTEFSQSIPIFYRGRYDLFGLHDKNLTKPLPTLKSSHSIGLQDGLGVSNTSTTVNVPSRTARARALLAMRNARKQPGTDAVLNSTNSHHSNKRRENVGYNVKTNAKDDQFMRSENERKETHEKKDRKDELFNYKKKARSKPNTAASTASIPKTPFSRVGSALHGIDGGQPANIISWEDDTDAILKAASVEKAHDELANVMDHYFGQVARDNFNKKFKSIAKNMERYPDDAALPDGKASPRTMYLRETTRAKVLPLPLILRKESNPMGIHLSHRGLGDARMGPVIKIIENLPAVQTIDLCDNRLTDLTLMPLATKLQSLRSLTYLDLSFNKMDDSSATIMDYISGDSCQLNTLLLNGADVDDGECKNLAEALCKNKSICKLGLSQNLIGKDELLNVVNPSLVTGGEALGEMLLVNTTLTELDLSWNSIRLDSAIAIAESLTVNSTLKTLILAYNSFGDMPSQILGSTLKVNKGLTALDLESNAITPKAATVLANAISFNETLLKLNINGNVLGKIGAQALVAAIQRSSRENRALQVSFINCDCVMDDHNIFSAGNPHGTWRLNLKEPYGQMVAAECLYLANYKAGCRIVKLTYNGNVVMLERSYVATSEEGEAGKMKKFKLEEFYKNSRIAATELLAGNMQEASRALNNLLAQFNFKMEDEQRMQVVEKTAELWTAKAKREGRDDLHEVFLYEIFFSLFVINDADLSGTMELDEFLETLSSLGKPNYDPEAAKRLMAEHDKDDSGSIDANEFGMILLNEFCQTEIPKGDLVDASTGLPWIIPTSGHCVIQLSYQCDIPTVFDIGEDYGIDNIIQSIRNAKTDDQREILFQNTTSSPYFFLSYDQAQLLFEEMQGLNRMPLELMASILPQIVNEEQTNQFLDTNLNQRGKLALRVKLGQLYNSYIGLHTGHYVIDMKIPEQRNGGRRLGAICVTEGKYSRQAGCISSQKGNNSNFRNEKLGVLPVDITGRWFSSCDTTKVLHCDYVSTMKPRKDTLAVSESRMDRIIKDLELADIKVVWDRLMTVKSRFLRKEARRNGICAMSIASVDGDDALEGGSNVDDNNSLGSVDTSIGGTEDHEEDSVEGDIIAAATTALNIANNNINNENKNKQPALRFSKMLMMARSMDDHSTSTDGESAAEKLRLEQEKKQKEAAKAAAAAKKAKDEERDPSAVLFTHLCPGCTVDYEQFPELVLEAPLSGQSLRDSYNEYIDSCYHFHDIYPEEKMRDISRTNYNATERPTTPEGMRNPPAPIRGQYSPIYPLAYKRILQLQLIMSSTYFSVVQLGRLLEYFPPDEVFLRVQVILSVFSHIIDLENMYLVYDNILTVNERIELLHRVGIMNIMDPLKPDRIYRLDLRRYDHREWAKILVALAVAEPGENWEQVEYRWAKYDDPVPGWVLPGPWANADDGGYNGGPRSYGWLTVYYRSTGNGCIPVWSMRKFLRKRTLAGMRKIL